MIDLIQNIKTEKLGISVQEISKLFAPNMDALPNVFLESVKHHLKEVRNFEVLFGYEIYQSHISVKEMIINNKHFEVNNEVYQLLRNSERIAVFACTVSRQLDAYLNSFVDISEQYVKDIIGTAIIDKTREYLYYNIKTDFPHFKATNSVSPGNCGWPMKVQEELFKLLPEHFIGISLSESGMMTPLKSLSGVIGLGPNVSFKHTDCKVCPSNNCLYRKESFNEFQS